MSGAHPEADQDQLVYDWNVRRRRTALAKQEVVFFDETLRDGIQGPSIIDPPIEAKKEILALTNALGVQWADIGLPGAGPRARSDVKALVQFIESEKLSIQPSAAARTHINDIRPIAEISQETGRAIEVMAFLGTSPIRQYAESWDLDRLLKLSGEAIEFAVKENLPICFVTEDTIRSRPETLAKLFLNAIDKGVNRLCLCDTVGHASPDGVRNLIQFTANLIDGTGADVGIDWHGHNDRGLGVANTIFALEYGADRLHGTALGIGERIGNAALDQVLLNLKLMGEIDNDLTKLEAWCTAVSTHMGWEIAPDYPLMGRDAFRTATGVHAAAVVKAEQKGDAWLADRIYSGVPAGLFGKEQSIEIGHMSGKSNVIYWLRKRGYELDEGLVDHIFAHAKAGNQTLSDAEVLALIDAWKSQHS
ncbi:MAG: LeuA family protein [Bradymonadia bacterium]